VVTALSQLACLFVQEEPVPRMSHYDSARQEHDIRTPKSDSASNSLTRLRSIRLFAVLLTAQLLAAPSIAFSQLCGMACNASYGSIRLSNINPPLRVLTLEQASPDGIFADNAIALSYNRSWSSGSGWSFDNTSYPATSFDFESYWNGNSEMNLDLFQRNTGIPLRPFGLSAAYDGSNVTFNIGNAPYAANAAGVTLAGGNGVLSSLLSITDQNGRSSYKNMLKMLRQDGTASVAWRAGGVPRVELALQQSLNADAFGNYGVLTFVGEWESGEPILGFEGNGASAMLISSLPFFTDTQPRFLLFGDGKLTWGSGTAEADTNLYRSTTSTLQTDGNLIVGGNLSVMGQKAALVTTASYGNREVYAIESPEEWFEDFGNAKLIRAQIIVRLDPVFKETVNTGRDYHVFLTPNGRCTLYVANKAPSFFRVKLLRGSPVCRFDYRVVAKRRGYEDMRLAQFPMNRPAAKE
jgi:hypothetical protein